MNLSLVPKVIKVKEQNTSEVRFPFFCRNFVVIQIRTKTIIVIYPNWKSVLNQKTNDANTFEENNYWEWAVCFYHVTYVFRVNVDSAVTWMSRNPLLEAGDISQI